MSSEIRIYLFAVNFHCVMMNSLNFHCVMMNSLIFDVICLTSREVFADLFLEFAKLPRFTYYNSYATEINILTAVLFKFLAIMMGSFYQY